MLRCHAGGTPQQSIASCTCASAKHSTPGQATYAGAGVRACVIGQTQHSQVAVVVLELSTSLSVDNGSSTN